jgi:hypothetical protein
MNRNKYSKHSLLSRATFVFPIIVDIPELIVFWDVI